MAEESSDVLPPLVISLDDILHLREKKRLRPHDVSFKSVFGGRDFKLSRNPEVERVKGEGASHPGGS